MTSNEFTVPLTDISIEQIDVVDLNDADYEIASEYHDYVLEWVLAPGNLSMHTRAMFMYDCAQGHIGAALTILLNEFGRPDSTIAPSEPPIWIEWAMYWQRGYDPTRVRGLPKPL